MPGFQWDNRCECTDWNVLQSCEPHSFVSSLPDPVPLPQILVKSASITPGWCNATLGCTASQDTEDLKVTWGSMGLPRGQRITLDPPSNPWTLTLSLPLSQPSAILKGTQHCSTPLQYKILKILKILIHSFAIILLNPINALMEVEQISQGGKAFSHSLSSSFWFLSTLPFIATVYHIYSM